MYENSKKNSNVFRKVNEFICMRIHWQPKVQYNQNFITLRHNKNLKKMNHIEEVKNIFHNINVEKLLKNCKKKNYPMNNQVK